MCDAFERALLRTAHALRATDTLAARACVVVLRGSQPTSSPPSPLPQSMSSTFYNNASKSLTRDPSSSTHDPSSSARNPSFFHRSPSASMASAAAQCSSSDTGVSPATKSLFHAAKSTNSLFHPTNSLSPHSPPPPLFTPGAAALSLEASDATNTLESSCSAGASHTTNHKPQTTNHKPQTTNHKPQL